MHIPQKLTMRKVRPDPRRSEAKRERCEKEGMGVSGSFTLFFRRGGREEG